MNERLRELAEQQGLTGPNYLISSQELEKFAELIVQECAKEFMASHKYGNPMAKTAVKDAARHVKRHFGVE
jgi:hypothetical protein